MHGLKKVFRTGNSELVLFENLSFQVRTGEMLAIVGESGAGKSTLLHILGVLDRASAGDVYFAQLDLGKLSEEAAAEFRGRELISGTVKLGMSGSFIICFPSSLRWRTWPCRC